MYDIAIIGAGVTGAAIARELSRYQLKLIVVDKGNDVCAGTSKDMAHPFLFQDLIDGNQDTCFLHITETIIDSSAEHTHGWT